MSVAVWCDRPEQTLTSVHPAYTSDAAADHESVAGSYSSAELAVPGSSPPPATRTLPSGSSVAVWSARGRAMLAAADQLFVAGSYSWAEALEMDPPTAFSPPTTSTFPSGSSVAVWSARGNTMSPAEDQESVAGSYSSAVMEAERPATPPPVRRTFSFPSSVAVAPVLATAMDAAA